MVVCNSNAPQEKGDWWYAGSRYGVTMLVIIVWCADFKIHFTFMTPVKEQSSMMSVACMKIVLAHALVKAKSFSTWTLWSDNGPHFASGKFIGWWTCDCMTDYATDDHDIEAMQFLFPPGWAVPNNVTPIRNFRDPKPMEG